MRKPLTIEATHAVYNHNHSCIHATHAITSSLHLHPPKLRKLHGFVRAFSAKLLHGATKNLALRWTLSRQAPYRTLKSPCQSSAPSGGRSHEAAYGSHEAAVVVSCMIRSSPAIALAAGITSRPTSLGAVLGTKNGKRRGSGSARTRRKPFVVSSARLQEICSTVGGLLLFPKAHPPQMSPKQIAGNLRTVSLRRDWSPSKGGSWESIHQECWLWVQTQSPGPG